MTQTQERYNPDITTRLNSPLSIAGSFQRSVDLTKRVFHSYEDPWIARILAFFTALALTVYVAFAIAWTVTLFITVVPVIWRMFRRGQRTKKMRHGEMMTALAHGDGPNG